MTTSFESFRIGRVGFTKKWLRITGISIFAVLSNSVDDAEATGSCLLDYQHLTVDAVGVLPKFPVEGEGH